MLEQLEITWKVSGFLPAPADRIGKYYREVVDHNYSKRIFGRQDLDNTSSSLIPTKLFHQALGSEICKIYGIHRQPQGQPYELPIENFGNHPVTLRFRVFGGVILVLTIQLPLVSTLASVSDLIQLQTLSSHPVLESVARFCFNIHYCPSPSQATVRAWHTKPLLRINANEKQVAISDLVTIVTRHTCLNERATREMLAKNEMLNFNEDLILIDKQGALFLNATVDSKNQRNRFERISSLYEYALYARSVKDLLAEGNQDGLSRLLPLVASLNSTLAAEVLSQSVSARRGWALIKSEFGLGRICSSSPAESPTANPKNKSTKTPFYKDPIFIGISALLALAASIAGVAQYFR